MKKNIQPCESRKLLIVNNQMGGSGTGLEKAKMKKSSSILTTDLIWQPDPGGGGFWPKKTVLLSE